MVVKYRDHILLIASLDAEWSRAAVEQGEPDEAIWGRVTGTHAAVERAAKAYRDNVDNNFRAWREGQSEEARQPPGSGTVDGRLFEVRTWLPFGHADTLSLVAVDDLDAAHTLVETFPNGVEEVTLAYCPEMGRYQTLWEGREGGTAPNPFREALDLFGESGSPPLLILSRLRMSPILTLGRALAAQSAMFDLMAAKIVEAWKVLRSRSHDSSLYGPDDLGQTRVTFLDLQDEEEIGILLTGNNHSVMMALVVAAQNLTLGEFRRDQKDAANEIFRARGMAELLKWESGGKPGETKEAGETGREAEEGDLLDAVGDCHLFRWSRSLAATSLVASRSAGPSTTSLPEVSGWLAVQTKVGMMLGHQRHAEEVIAKFQPLRSHVHEGGDKPEFRLHALGTDDLILEWRGVPESGGFSRLVPTERAIGLWPSLAASIAGGRRDFTGWSSQISIPVPEDPLFHPVVGGNHHHMLHRLMGELARNRPLPCLDDDRLREMTRQYGLPVSVRRPLIFLVQNFRQVITNPLLFDVVLDFLDVMETASHLLSVALPQALPEVMTRHAVQSVEDYTIRAPQSLVDAINQLLEGLADALELRLRHIYPETPVRDWSLDLRSQSHQILLGAEAALKCAVALIRKDVLDLHQEKEKAGQTKVIRSCLGVLLRLTFRSGIDLTYLRAPRFFSAQGNVPAGSASGEPVRLALFEADFPHLTSIGGYADLFHESFHLVFEEIADKEMILFSELPLLQVDLPDVLDSDFGSDMSALGVDTAIKEMFVHLMMLLFVFDGDSDLLLREHLEGLASSQATAFPIREGDERLTICELLFHAVAPVVWLESVLGASLVEGEAKGPELCRWQKDPAMPELPSLREFGERVWDKMTDYAEAYPDFELYFGGSADGAGEMVREHCCSLYARCHLALPTMWFAARAIYAHHVERVASEHGYSDPEVAKKSARDHYFNFSNPDREEILKSEAVAVFTALQNTVDREIRHCWLDATDSFAPVAGMNPKLPAVDKPAVLKQGDAIDANLLVRRSLYHYLARYRRQVFRGESRITLPRLRTNGKVDVERLKEQPHAPFLIDRTAVPLFCCVPSQRRCRLGHDIAVLKTVWDIASRNRARRLVSLIDACSSNPTPS